MNAQTTQTAGAPCACEPLAALTLGFAFHPLDTLRAIEAEAARLNLPDWTHGLEPTDAELDALEAELSALEWEAPVPPENWWREVSPSAWAEGPDHGFNAREVAA